MKKVIKFVNGAEIRGTFEHLWFIDENGEMKMEIEGIKLIQHNANGINNPDDPSYPYKLEAYFSPPEFMTFAFVSLYGGSEIIIVRGKTKEALEKFIELNNLKSHPRLRSLTITEG